MTPHEWTIVKKAPEGSSLTLWACRQCGSSLYSSQSPFAESGAVLVVYSGTSVLAGDVSSDCDVEAVRITLRS